MPIFKNYFQGSENKKTNDGSSDEQMDKIISYFDFIIEMPILSRQENIHPMDLIYSKESSDFDTKQIGKQSKLRNI